MVGFDELTAFLQSQFLYLIGRLRSESETDSFCLGTCNPDADSWVLNWVLYYLDDRGYPDPDKHGKVLYYVIYEDKPIFAEDPQELIDKYPELCYNYNPITGEDEVVMPNTFTYVSGNIYDNPALIKANPKYLANLKSQTAINRARLLDGKPKTAVNVW